MRDRRQGAARITGDPFFLTRLGRRRCRPAVAHVQKAVLFAATVRALHDAHAHVGRRSGLDNNADNADPGGGGRGGGSRGRRQPGNPGGAVWRSHWLLLLLFLLRSGGGGGGGGGRRPVVGSCDAMVLARAGEVEQDFIEAGPACMAGAAAYPVMITHAAQQYN